MAEPGVKVTTSLGTWVALRPQQSPARCKSWLAGAIGGLGSPVRPLAGLQLFVGGFYPVITYTLLFCNLTHHEDLYELATGRFRVCCFNPNKPGQDSAVTGHWQGAWSQRHGQDWITVCRPPGSWPPASPLWLSLRVLLHHRGRSNKASRLTLSQKFSRPLLTVCINTCLFATWPAYVLLILVILFLTPFCGSSSSPNCLGPVLFSFVAL